MLRRHRLTSADRVGNALVLPDGEQRPSRIGGPPLENPVVVLHHLSGDRLAEAVDHLVEQLEAVDGLHHVVDCDVLTRDGAGLVM